MKRNIFPGEEWIYFKIYISPIGANQILIENILPFTNSLLERKIINQWFFIRYTDPNFHIRLRLKLNSLDSIGLVIQEMNKSLQGGIHNNIICRIQLDTYQRELERYGTDSIEYCENFFFRDSEEVLKFISQTPDEWTMIINSINWISYIYKTLAIDNKDLLKAIRTSAEAYNKEHNLNSDQIAEINLLYRKNEPQILTAIKESNTKYFRILDEITHEYLLKILPSLIHMHLNRLFSSRQRFYECIIYNLLSKGLKTLSFTN